MSDDPYLDNRPGGPTAGDIVVASLIAGAFLFFPLLIIFNAKGNYMSFVTTLVAAAVTAIMIGFALVTGLLMLTGGAG